MVVSSIALFLLACPSLRRESIAFGKQASYLVRAPGQIEVFVNFQISLGCIATYGDGGLPKPGPRSRVWALNSTLPMLSRPQMYIRPNANADFDGMHGIVHIALQKTHFVYRLACKTRPDRVRQPFRGKHSEDVISVSSYFQLRWLVP
jgi:hypothetical protein